MSANPSLSSGEGPGPSSSPRSYAGPERQYAAADKIWSKKPFFDAQYSGCARHSEIKSGICGRLAAIQSHRSFIARRGGRKRGRRGASKTAPASQEQRSRFCTKLASRRRNAVAVCAEQNTCAILRVVLANVAGLPKHYSQEAPFESAINTMTNVWAI